jgi:chitin disaccharide deacetylase
MRRIVVCADDYALSPGVSRAIRELASRGRLNAASVMTVIPGFEQECASLLSTPCPIPLAIGLHATLTGAFAPLAALPMATADGRFPPLSKLLPPLGYFRIDRKAVKAEVAAQIAALRKAIGRAPDFVDGHQHVQLMPGVRMPLLEAVLEAAPKAWVRQCGAAAGASARGGKARFIEFLSHGFRRRAEKLGIAFNPAFSGAYDFSTAENFGALFARFLDGLPDRGVVMCHPGFVDAALVARDPLTHRREAEYAFLAGDDFPAMLARAGASLV